MICILMFLAKIFFGVIFIGFGILVIMLLVYFGVGLFNEIKSEIDDRDKKK